MARWITGMRKTMAATRSPRPDRIQHVAHRPHHQIAMLGAVSQLTTWLSDSLDLNGPVVVLPDARDPSRPREHIVSAIANTLDAPVLPASNDAGWVRLMSLEGAALKSADIRADAVAGTELLVVTTPHSRSGAARAADALFHPNTQLRAAALPQSGAVELAVWASPVWVVVMPRPQVSIACTTRSAVLAELLALGAYRLTERSQSVEAVSPWEEPTVQRLFELELESGGFQTTLRIDASLATERAWINRLAETIGAKIAAE